MISRVRSFSRPSPSFVLSPTSLLLRTDPPPRKGGCYLFDPSETSSLRNVGRRHFLPQFIHVFATTSTWNSFGGLPGICTDLKKDFKDAKSLGLHGPFGTRRFIKMLSEDEVLREVDYFQDDLIKVDYYILDPVVSSRPSKLLYPAWNNLCIVYKDEYAGDDNHVRDDTVVAYVVRFNDDPNNKTLIINVPDCRYFESLSKILDGIDVNTVYHLTPSHVRNADEYRRWETTLRDVKRHINRDGNLDNVKNESIITGFVDKLTSVYDKDTFRLRDGRPAKVYPEITFLGTGSKRSTPFRNVSGIWIQISRNSSALLDCGEGTLRRMFLAFGAEKSRQLLRTLKFIFISHRHNDHHFGLISVLRARELEFFDSKIPKLYLIAPKSFKPFLNRYHEQFEDVTTSLFHILPERLKLNNDKDKVLHRHLMTKLLHDTELKRISTCFADHVKNSYSLSFVHSSSDYNIVYSADTRPNDALVRLGTDYKGYADLLIHEATMPSHLGQYAQTQQHSTIAEAITIGQRMAARNVILTHFAEKYVLPHIEDVVASSDIGCSIAFDLMSVDPENVSRIRLDLERKRKLVDTFPEQTNKLKLEKLNWKQQIQLK